MIGQTISHYRLLKKLGAGGMGEVYLAHDTKLDRKLALKILPVELATNHDRMRRFTQEAKAAAALSHPNIAHIYEIGESDGNQNLGREASGKHDQAASALSTMLQQYSTPGAVVGTVGYMSPEQAQGKTSEIDHRSDVFAFGCILYEAVTRRQAFEGNDAIDSLNKIIRESPRPISDFRPDSPNHLQRIVRRCLAKDREDRYQTIKDVAIELRELRRELNNATASAVFPGTRVETLERL